MKKSTFFQLRALGVLAALVLMSSCTPMMTSVRQSPDFAGTQRSVRVVAVLPLDLEHYLINFNTGNERDVTKEIEIKTELSENIKAELEKRGYIVKTDLVERVGGDGKQFSAEYEQLRTAYAQASNELYARRNVPVDESTKFKASVGSAANIFATADDADALLVVRYSGFDKSGAQMTQEILLGAASSLASSRAARGSSSSGGKSGPQPYPSSVQMNPAAAPNGKAIEVALIDGASGDVLWANADGVSQEGVGTMLYRAMATLPPSNRSWQHPDLASAKRAVRTIGLLPPEVEQVRVGFSSNERDVGKEAQLRAQLSESIKAELEKRGYTAKTSLLQRLNGDDSQLSAEFERFKAAYTQAVNDLYKRGVPIGPQSKVSVGTVATAFSTAAGADGLIVTRYSGFEKTGTRGTQDALVSGIVGFITMANMTKPAPSSSPSGGKIEVTLIDGASGEILWENTYGIAPEEAGAILAKAMTTFPTANSPEAARPVSESATSGAATTR